MRWNYSIYSIILSNLKAVISLFFRSLLLIRIELSVIDCLLCVIYHKDCVNVLLHSEALLAVSFLGFYRSQTIERKNYFPYILTIKYNYECLGSIYLIEQRFPNSFRVSSAICIEWSWEFVFYQCLIMLILLLWKSYCQNHCFQKSRYEKNLKPLHVEHSTLGNKAHCCDTDEL